MQYGVEALKKIFSNCISCCSIFKLEEILGFYSQKYPNFSMFRTRMSLTYFEDAENQECPKMWVDVDWKTVKEAISSAVRKVDWSRYLE